MNISLTDDLKQFVDAQVSAHGCASTSEYLRDLIRKQRDVEQLRTLLMEGANSGRGCIVDDVFFVQLRNIAKGRARA